jgi:peptidoglycan-associated lipoprotein
MKTLNRFALTAAVAASILLGACSSTPVAPDQKSIAVAAPATVAGPAAKPTTPIPIVTTPVAAHLDPASLLFQKRSVYFDFDQSAVKPEYNLMLELHGKYLASHPNVAIKVQGNTDEQGGAEYNLALGQKRAEAVTRTLKVFGAKDSQMEAVSFGKEKPKANGHDEAAHALNRRADLAYPEK